MDNFLEYNKKYKDLLKDNTTELKDFVIIITNSSKEFDLYITDSILKAFHFIKSRICEGCLSIPLDNINDLLSSSCGTLMNIELIKKSDYKKYFENIDSDHELDIWTEEWNNMLYEIKNDFKNLIK